MKILQLGHTYTGNPAVAFSPDKRINVIDLKEKEKVIYNFLRQMLFQIYLEIKYT